jgi:hypothetical protein
MPSDSTPIILAAGPVELLIAGDTPGLSAGVVLMRNAVDGDSEPLLTEPKYLVVGPTNEVVADGLFTSLNVVMSGVGNAAAIQPAANTFASKYQVLTSPFIENSMYVGNSTTKWFLFCDPTVGPAAFLVAFLNAVESPVIEQSESDFDTLGVRFRGWLDFAVAQLDKQGGIMSTGTT